MAHWCEAAVTRDGIAMLNEMMAGRNLTLTAAYGGTGRVDADALSNQEDLLRRMQLLHLVDELDGPEGKTVTVQVENQASEEGYLLQQIGVFARLEPEGGRLATEEKLLFLMQDDGVQIPPMTEESFLLEIYCLLRIDSDGRLTVTVDPSGLVTIQRLRETADQYRALPGEGDPTLATVGTVGQRYLNTLTGREFVCVAVEEDGYHWRAEATEDGLEALRDEIVLSIMKNELALPLAAGDGEPLLTSGGTPILAVYHPDRSAGILAAMEAMAGQLSAGARAYTDKEALGLTAKIAAAKAEAVSAARADAEAAVHSATEKIVYRLRWDMYQHNNGDGPETHPSFLRQSGSMILLPPKDLDHEPEV